MLQNGLTHRTMTHTGTISHSAPELLSHGRMSPAADVYAFGIMGECAALCQLLPGRALFVGLLGQGSWWQQC